MHKFKVMRVSKRIWLVYEFVAFLILRQNIIKVFGFKTIASVVQLQRRWRKFDKIPSRPVFHFILIAAKNYHHRHPCWKQNGLLWKEIGKKTYTHRVERIKRIINGWWSVRVGENASLGTISSVWRPVCSSTEVII